MGTVYDGARVAVDVCMGVAPGEHVLIVTDFPTQTVGQALRKAAEKASPHNVRLELLEDFGKRPLTSLPKPLEECIRWANVTFYAARSMAGELGLRKSFIRLAKECARHAHMPSINERLMQEGMSADYEKISGISKRVHELVATAKTARVTSPAGADLTVEFHPQWKWKVSDGIFRTRGTWGNLPDGEVYTAAWKANGIVVAEELGDWFSDKYGVLERSPVSIRVEGSRADVRTINCSNTSLRGDLIEYLETDRNSNRLGEFAIGTNIFLKQLVGNLLQDEKLPSVHVAFGDPYPDETGADWQSRTHVDVIMKNSTLWVNDTRIMENGHLLL